MISIMSKRGLSREPFRGLAFAALLAMAAGSLCGQAELQRFVPDDVASGDQVGSSAALSGRYALTGAQEDRLPGSNVGSVYVYDPSTGEFLRKLIASNPAVGDQFGESVAIADHVAFVGAPNTDRAGANSGSVYVFDLKTGTEEAELVPSDASVLAHFGNSVAADGFHLLIGAYEDSEAADGAGAVYVFDIEDFEERRKLTASDAFAFDAFGFSVAVAGDFAVVGAPFANGLKGRAYVFDLTSGEELRKIEPASLATVDAFGQALDADGAVAVIGSPNDDEGATNAGAAYVVDLETGTVVWKLRAEDASAFALFGSSVAVRGGFALIGARSADGLGAAYLFDLSSGEQVYKLRHRGGAPNDQFGYAVALSASALLVGENQSDGLTGAAYLFSRRPVVLGPASGEGVEVRFAGRLQLSNDLESWTELVPEPTSPYILVPEADPRFLRAELE
jgi:outer membrane protein assembly factor BamB